MKAAKLFNKRDLRIVDTNLRTIKENEALIKVRSVGICKSDVHYYEYGFIGETVLKEPIILGHEFAGEIVQVGNNVNSFRVGDRVAVDPALSCGICEYCKKGNPNLCPTVKFCGTAPIDGAFSEFYIANQQQLFVLPDEISYEYGALLEPLGVAIHSRNIAKPNIDQKICILGTGSIGILIFKLLQLKEIKYILGIDIQKYRLEKVKKMGISETLLLSNSESDEEKIKSFENSFDIVFEVAGSLNSPFLATRLCKPGGKVILIGINPENKLFLNESIIRRKGLTLKAIRRMKHTYPEAIELVKDNKIDLKDIITHKFSLNETQEAFEMVMSYNDSVLKVIINP